jgi:murein DD-endopeptidase MepM/ murein hydrolase activator NlpD
MSRTISVLAVLFLLMACKEDQTASVVSTPTIAPFTSISTIVPTLVATSVPTATAVPSLVSTSTPTATTVPPTVTPTDLSTATPPPTAAPTSTPLPTTPSTPTTSSTPEALRYVFPVKAKRYSISSSHHDYPASDIACPIGSEFVAVTDGVVDFVSRTDKWPQTRNNADKGGLSVAIIGDDGVRYYGSHLSEVAEGIEPGVKVKAGQLLGLTGESGNAAGVYPQLHFGISHPTTPDDWQVRRGEIWPQKYLKAWARGENVAPKLAP